MNLPPRPHSRSPSPVPHVAQLPSFSLVGALEFRDVVQSLQRESSANSLSIFDSPATPYAGGHYRTLAKRSPRSSLNSSITLDEEAMHTLRLGRTSPRSHGTSEVERMTRQELPDQENEDYFSSSPAHTVPAIFRTPASPSTTASELDSEEALYIPRSRWQRIWLGTRKAFHILFPTLAHLRKQTVLVQLAFILAAPAVLCLTLTLPVVSPSNDSSRLSPEKTFGSDSRLVEFEEEGMERILIAEEEIEEDHELAYNKWLTAAQCVFGPLFCVQVLFGVYMRLLGEHISEYFVRGHYLAIAGNPDLGNFCGNSRPDFL